jgi:hypothetical protein
VEERYRAVQSLATEVADTSAQKATSAIKEFEQFKEEIALRQQQLAEKAGEGVRKTTRQEPSQREKPIKVLQHEIIQNQTMVEKQLHITFKVLKLLAGFVDDLSKKDKTVMKNKESKIKEIEIAKEKKAKEAEIAKERKKNTTGDNIKQKSNWRSWISSPWKSKTPSSPTPLPLQSSSNSLNTPNPSTTDDNNEAVVSSIEASLPLVNEQSVRLSAPHSGLQEDKEKYSVTGLLGLQALESTTSLEKIEEIEKYFLSLEYEMEQCGLGKRGWDEEEHDFMFEIEYETLIKTYSAFVEELKNLQALDVQLKQLEVLKELQQQSDEKVEDSTL